MFFQRNLLQVAKLHVGAEPPQNLREGDATVPSQSALHTHSDCLALSDFSRYQLLCLTEQASVTLQAHQLLLQNFISTISVVIRICSPGSKFARSWRRWSSRSANRHWARKCRACQWCGCSSIRSSGSRSAPAQ